MRKHTTHHYGCECREELLNGLLVEAEKYHREILNRDRGHLAEGPEDCCALSVKIAKAHAAGVWK